MISPIKFIKHMRSALVSRRSWDKNCERWNSSGKKHCGILGL